MHQPALKQDRFTYGDYRRWPDDERWELIDGRAYDMCPAPSRGHQAMVVGRNRGQTTFSRSVIG